MFVSQTNCCYIFKDDGVYACSEAELADADDDDYTKDALYLVDLNERRSSVTNFPNRRMVVSSSPQQDRYKGWVKHRDAVTFYMKTWGAEEMRRIR